jgi:large subunit ribosomal protein L25
MERTIIQASKRSAENGRKLLKKGIVPALIYSHGKTEEIQLGAEQLMPLLQNGISESVLFDLQIEDKTEVALIKDYQLHPVQDQFLHIDFYKITYGEKLRTKIPVHFVGKSIGVAAGGILETFVKDLEIETLPKHLIPALEVNISDMNIHDTLHLSQIQLPPETKVLVDGDISICHIAQSAKARKGAEEEEEQETEE